ncbi:MAG: hypothetical protein ACK2UY_02760, partial [Anaerolineae bacterium]
MSRDCEHHAHFHICSFAHLPLRPSNVIIYPREIMAKKARTPIHEYDDSFAIELGGEGQPQE